MKIPPPPTVPPVPKAPLFAGAQEKIRNDRLGTDIRTMLDNLLRVTDTPGWREMLVKFKSVVKPGGTCDPSRLPYQTIGPNLVGDKGAALACLYTRLSWIIQLYWKLVLTGNENEHHIRQYMKDIESMLAMTDARGNKLKLSQVLTQCSVEGDLRHGFWIEVPACTTT